MKMAKIVPIISYSNIFVYLEQIYLFGKTCIFTKSNLFGYSFVIFLSCQIHLDIILSSIYGNEYIRIFIWPKKNDIRPTLPHCTFLHTGWLIYRSTGSHTTCDNTSTTSTNTIINNSPH